MQIQLSNKRYWNSNIIAKYLWPKDFPDVNVGSCEYEIGELFELMKLLGFPCNDSCNLPLPAQTYRMEGGYRLDDDFDIPELVKMMLTMQSKKFIHAKAKIYIKGKEVACVELKVDYSLKWWSRLDYILEFHCTIKHSELNNLNYNGYRYCAFLRP